jgi:hypothetical protein
VLVIIEAAGSACPLGQGRTFAIGAAGDGSGNKWASGAEKLDSDRLVRPPGSEPPRKNDRLDQDPS